MSVTLRLSRQGFGMELRRGTFDIEVDGQHAGTIDWHGEAEIEMGQGHHSLQLRAGRFASPSHTFDASDGTVVSFRCHGAMIWPRYVASILKPDLAISLIRE